MNFELIINYLATLTNPDRSQLIQFIKKTGDSVSLRLVPIRKVIIRFTQLQSLTEFKRIEQFKLLKPAFLQLSTKLLLALVCEKVAVCVLFVSIMF